MKKILTITLILALLIPLAVAEAPVDVKALSDTELKSIYVAVKEELMERKLWEESTLPAGVYQAGKALPEGAYECILKNDGRVIIYQDYEHFLNDRINNFLDLEKGQEFTLSLYGDVVYYLTFNSTVRPFIGPMW